MDQKHSVNSWLTLTFAPKGVNVPDAESSFGDPQSIGNLDRPRGSVASLRRARARDGVHWHPRFATQYFVPDYAAERHHDLPAKIILYARRIFGDVATDAILVETLFGTGVRKFLRNF